VNKFSRIACLFLLLFIQNNLFAQILIKDSKQVYEISSGWTFQPEGLMPKQVQVGKGLVSQNLLPPISGIYSVEIEYSVLKSQAILS
jgi:hypothetical protein